MACNPSNPCQKSTCQSCQAPPAAATGCPVGPIDTNCVVYHLTPGQVSRLSCLKIANGANLTQILEAIDKRLCEAAPTSAASLNLGCLVPTGTTRPASLNAVIELLAAAICQLKNDTSLANIIAQLLASSTFLNGLISLLANSSAFINALLNNNEFLTKLAQNATFINALVNNSDFLTKLANSSEFITKLTANSEFINKVGAALVNNSSFLSQLTQALTSNPGLKDAFCCGSSTSPCAGMVVNGVTLTDCNCVPPTNLQLTGPASVTPNADVTYTLAYAGTQGQVSWSVTGGTVQAQTATTVTARFTGTGSVKATLVGCNGVAQEKTLVISLGSGQVCTPVSGLIITGETTSFSAGQDAGIPLSYAWSVTGGTISGSSTASTVAVTWNSPTRSVSLSVTDCSGTPKTATKSVSSGVCFDPSSLVIQGLSNVYQGSTITYVAGVQGSGPFTYFWANSNADTVINNTSGTAQIIFTTLGSVTVTLTVNGCGQTRTVTLPVTVNASSIQNLSAASASNSPTGALIVSFEDSAGAGPYAYTLTDDQGVVRDSGSFI